MGRHAAYEHYIERIHMMPGPMTQNYSSVIRERLVTVAEIEGTIDDEEPDAVFENWLRRIRASIAG